MSGIKDSYTAALEVSLQNYKDALEKYEQLVKHKNAEIHALMILLSMARKHVPSDADGLGQNIDEVLKK